MAIVEVFGSERYNIKTDGYDVSPNMATLERIKAKGCAPIGGSVKLVDSSLLDDTGTYRPEAK
jgi:hypothetical protein